MLKKPFKMSSIRRLCGSFLAVVCVAHSIDSVRVWPKLRLTIKWFLNGNLLTVFWNWTMPCTPELPDVSSDLTMYSVLFLLYFSFNEPCNRIRKKMFYIHVYHNRVQGIRFIFSICLCIGWWRSNNYMLFYMFILFWYFFGFLSNFVFFVS